jgi:endoglucanase
MKKESLNIGVNLGGWISQYKKFDRRHFDTFIGEGDIRRISDWGFDHVRLPIDYEVLEDGAGPDVYPDSGFAYLDRCLAWCQAAGIRVIFDVHRAPGYSFTNTLEAEKTEENTLFSDPSCRDRFLHLWEALARRYAGAAEDALAFELLNEIVLTDGSAWNETAQQAIRRIREIEPERLMIIGGNNYGAVNELINIRVNPDPNLLFTFHFYEPMAVTHQRAYWVAEMEKYGRAVSYPGDAADLSEFIAANYPEHMNRYKNSFGRKLNRDFLSEMVKPALQFKAETGEALYCGEFGVIDRAPVQTRINWTRDFIDVLNEGKIGYAYWTYKEMDFGLVDKDGRVVNEEIVRVVTGKT